MFLIIGYLTNVKQESFLYPKALQKGLNFLLENDPAVLTPGHYEIDGNEIFATVKDFAATKSKENRRWESHDEYLDIQYIVAGEEINGFAPIGDVGEIEEDRGNKFYYKNASSATSVIVSAGMFVIYFPWDAHRTQCKVGNLTGKAKKIVIKVAMKALDSHS